MAKVIGFDESVKRRCTCKNCAAIVEYLPSEVKMDYTLDYTGDRDYYKYITCPNCRDQIKVLGY